MKPICLTIISVLFIGCNSDKNSSSVPDYLMGNFEDDYEIYYSMSDSVFKMNSGTKFHIVKWNSEEQYFIAENDSSNEFDAGLYSRIDWMKFENMDPYEWGFCLTAYKSVSPDSAEAVLPADRLNPRTGCNGFPFSRMKPIKP